MFVLMISRSSSKLGYLESETRSPAKSKENLVDTLVVTFFEVIIMNLAQNICLDDFKEKFGTRSLMTIIHGPVTFLSFFFSFR